MYFQFLFLLSSMYSVFYDTRHPLGSAIGKIRQILNSENMRGTRLHLSVLASALANSHSIKLARFGGSVVVHRLIERKKEKRISINFMYKRFSVFWRVSLSLSLSLSLTLSLSLYIYIYIFFDTDGTVYIISRLKEYKKKRILNIICY